MNNGWSITFLSACKYWSSLLAIIQFKPYYPQSTNLWCFHWYENWPRSNKGQETSCRKKSDDSKQATCSTELVSPCYPQSRQRKKGHKIKVELTLPIYWGDIAEKNWEEIPPMVWSHNQGIGTQPSDQQNQIDAKQAHSDSSGLLKYSGEFRTFNLIKRWPVRSYWQAAKIRIITGLKRVDPEQTSTMLGLYTPC